MPDYVQMFYNSAAASADPTAFFSLLFPALARLLPIITLSPFFGARILPHPVKVTFAITLFILFLPHVLTVITRPIPFNSFIIFLAIKEIFVGFSMGFIMGLPFTVVQNVGMMIDHQRGGASLMVNDPTIQNQSSPMGLLFNSMLIYIFYLIDGPFYFFNAMVLAYDMVPPDQFLPPLFFNEHSSFWVIMFGIFNKVMVVSVQLGAPALIAILMTDMFLGIANRLAPQVQITFLGMPLKSLLALLVITIGWQLHNKQTIIELLRWVETLNNAITGMGANG